ncbi:hypothetical protein Vadar_031377 [Vaccinium darrowii]|uniref:Uncharacterized protein n=1 Tax=Vaccinium darrowii TaxID=229202 RepID=A0ACB7YRH6_9ERIC|nr:hypothetical protein Vadar_031377 [Vaccinium darrowii]
MPLFHLRQTTIFVKFARKELIPTFGSIIVGNATNIYIRNVSFPQVVENHMCQIGVALPVVSINTGSILLNPIKTYFAACARAMCMMILWLTYVHNDTPTVQTLEASWVKINWVWRWRRLLKFNTNGTEATELDSSNSVTASSDKVPIKSQELDPTVILLPRRDDSFDIITQFIKNTSEQGKYKEATEIKHICHDHPLTYVDFEKPIDQAASRSMSDVSSLLGWERNAGKCGGCAQSISAPFYHCVECNFSLHVWCAELPEKLQHPGHSEHTLSLTMAKYYVECVGCHLFQNTMHYVCGECAFYLDCKCASLPRVIKHEEHRHNLALRPPSDSKCISCGVTSTRISFECGGCQHYLCTRQMTIFAKFVRKKLIPTIGSIIVGNATNIFIRTASFPQLVENHICHLGNPLPPVLRISTGSLMLNSMKTYRAACARRMCIR